MAKYIIDIPDKWVDITNGLHIPIETGWDVGDFRIDTGLKLTPYTEPDQEAIEDEVWKFARGLLNYTDDDWETITNMLLLDIPYQSAKASYEAWLKRKDEIRVGDEVEYECDGEVVKFIVTGVIGSTVYGFKSPCDYDDVGEWCDIKGLRKTGRHFDEVEELVKKMRKSDED